MLAEEDEVQLFRLAGVKDSFVIYDTEGAKKILLELSKSENYKLIIVSNRIAHKLENLITDISTKQLYPVIVTIPDRTGATEKKVDSIRDLVKRAVGFDMKVK